MTKAIAFMWAALRWVLKRILLAITSNENSLDAAGYKVGTLQGMSRRYEILLFQAQITDLESLANADLPALAKLAQEKEPTDNQLSRLLTLPRTMLYDWVAQAVLVCALHELHKSASDRQRLMGTWVRALRAVGIRTACDLHEVSHDKERLLRALTAAQSAIERQETAEGDGDASSSVSTFTQENLDRLLKTINKNASWKSNINEIERSPGTVNPSAQPGENQ
jgi:hypothetical protein